MAILTIAATKMPLVEQELSGSKGCPSYRLILEKTMQSEVQGQLLPSQGPSQASGMGGRLA